MYMSIGLLFFNVGLMVAIGAAAAKQQAQQRIKDRKLELLRHQVYKVFVAVIFLQTRFVWVVSVTPATPSLRSCQVLVDKQEDKEKVRCVRDGGSLAHESHRST